MTGKIEQIVPQIYGYGGAWVLKGADCLLPTYLQFQLWHIFNSSFYLSCVIENSMEKQTKSDVKPGAKKRVHFLQRFCLFDVCTSIPLRIWEEKQTTDHLIRLLLGKKQAHGNREVGCTEKSERSKCAISNSSVYRIKALLKSTSAYHRHYSLSCLNFSEKLSLVCRETTTY